MRLLIVTQIVDVHDPILGFFHRWILEFSKQCEQVTVVCLKKGKYLFPEHVQVLSLGKEEGKSRFHYICNFFRYVIQKQDAYDAVFVHMNPMYVILGSLFWKLQGKKIALWYTHKSVDIKLRIATFLSDVIYTASKESFRLMSKKVIVTGHGIDIDLFTALEKPQSSRKKVAVIGRVSPTKELLFIMQAFTSLLLRRKGEIVLEIVGSPQNEIEASYKNKLVDEIQKLGVSEYVHFIGSVSQADLPKYLAGVDFTVNVSNTGSLDKAVLESLACGIPVITSNEAFKDMLSPLGLFFPKNEFKDAVALVENSKQFDRDMLRNEIIKAHSLERLISRIMSVL